jgi:hypothetical protein
VRHGPHQGELIWNDLEHHDVLRLLHNPCYAGAFTFGRTRTTKTIDGKRHITALPQDEWQVVVRDAHVGYITWAEYETHLTQLAANRQAYANARLSPPREGPALLQGIIICGICGERMTVRYHQRSGQRIIPDYVCQRAGIAQAANPCQRLLGRDLEQAITELLAEVVIPETIALTLAIQDDLVAQAAEAERLRQLQVQRAQYEADLAQRRYLRVDPDNRLVAEVLEAEWNAKLRALEMAQEVVEQQRVQDQYRLSAAERQQMVALPDAFGRFWHSPQTTARDRKRVVRLLIADVTVTKGDQITAHVRFTGGASRTLTIASPPPFTESRLTSAETLAAIDRLLETSTDAEIAEQLNHEGYQTFAGLPFQALHVSQLRRNHGLKNRYTRLREAGMLTAEELAARLQVQVQTVWHWYHTGQIQGARYNDRGSCLFAPLDTRPCSRRRASRSGT